jgi:hypothetical protein
MFLLTLTYLHYDTETRKTLRRGAIIDDAPNAQGGQGSALGPGTVKQRNRVEVVTEALEANWESVPRPRRAELLVSFSGSTRGPGGSARKHRLCLRGHGGAAAHTGPGRKGPDVWPPRIKVGAEERSPSAPLLRHQLSKNAGARRRAARPASLFPPSPSHPEGTLPSSTSSSSRFPRVSSLTKTSSSLLLCSQRAFPSYPDDAKRPPDRVPRSSLPARDRERSFPRPASRPRRREWSSKPFPGHAHQEK